MQRSIPEQDQSQEEPVAEVKQATKEEPVQKEEPKPVQREEPKPAAREEPKPVAVEESIVEADQE